MTTELAQRREFDENELALLKKTIAEGCTDLEFALFHQVVRNTGLDPFAKQIYAVKRRRRTRDGEGFEEYLVIQTGIDGFRTVADRKRDEHGARLHQGMTLPWFYDTATKEWVDVWTDANRPPHACKIGVYRADAKEPRWFTVYYENLVQRYRGKNGMMGDPQEQWKGMKAVSQLAKCAEAAALRQNYPHDLGNIYLAEEMAQAETVEDEANRKKTEDAEDFLKSLDPQLGQRLAAAGFDSEAKVRALFNESGQTLEGLIQGLEAQELVSRLDDGVKKKMAVIGRARNPHDARRLVIKAGGTVEKLTSYLDSCAEAAEEAPAKPVEVPPAKEEVQQPLVPAPSTETTSPKVPPKGMRVPRKS